MAGGGGYELQSQRAYRRPAPSCERQEGASTQSHGQQTERRGSHPRGAGGRGAALQTVRDDAMRLGRARGPAAPECPGAEGTRGPDRRGSPTAGAGTPGPGPRCVHCRRTSAAPVPPLSLTLQLQYPPGTPPHGGRTFARRARQSNQCSGHRPQRPHPPKHHPLLQPGLPNPCRLGGPRVGGMATSPLPSWGSPTRGQKNGGKRGQPGGNRGKICPAHPARQGRDGGGGGRGFWLGPPPPRVPLWSLPKAGRKFLSVNPLGAKGTKEKLWLSALNIGRVGGGSRGVRGWGCAPPSSHGVRPFQYITAPTYSHDAPLHLRAHPLTLPQTAVTVGYTAGALASVAGRDTTASRGGLPRTRRFCPETRALARDTGGGQRHARQTTRIHNATAHTRQGVAV